MAYGSAGLITMLASFEAILISQPNPPPISVPGVTGYTNNAYEPRALCALLAFVLFCWAVGLAWQARQMVRPRSPHARTSCSGAAQMMLQIDPSDPTPV